MTDKQIIIDGVDISGCEYCLKMTKYRCTIQRDVYKCLCEENPNCYYKQLKRAENQIVVLNKMVDTKEQECEELNKTITNLENIRDEFSTKLDQLKGENVGVLKQLEFVRTLNTVQEAEIRKLKQTLTEIKEIAKENIRIADLEGLNGVYRRGLATQILQKISEVENNGR